MTPSPPRGRGRRVPSIIVHGGAGAPLESAAEFRPGMRAAVVAGWAVLSAGGRALDAVEAAVRTLEDHERFNAGRGSVLTEAGTVEMDASIMEGGRVAGGGVAGGGAVVWWRTAATSCGWPTALMRSPETWDCRSAIRRR